MQFRLNSLVRRGCVAALVASALLAVPASPATALAASAEDIGDLEDLTPITVCEVSEPTTDEAELMASSTAPIYDYQVYYLDGLGDDWYNNGDVMRYLYIRTDDPDVNFTLEFDGESTGTSAYFNSNPFADVDNLGVTSGCLRVPGGYIMGCAFETDATGPQTLKLYEQKVNNYGYITRKALAATFTANFVDYDQAVNQWADDAIDRYTNSSMNPLEKMRAVSDGLREEFRYLLNDGTYLIHLVTQPASPFFVSKHWDSMTSPAALCRIAERIGGFSDIHNCYYDKEDWQNQHYYCRVTYNGDVRYYYACPFSETGKIDRSSIKKINFNNLSSSVFDVPRNFKQMESQGEQATRYVISTVSTNGTVSITGGNTAAAGETVRLTVTPNKGYEISSVTATAKNGSRVTVSGTGSTRTFTMPASAVTVTATFKKIQLKTQTITCQSYFYKDLGDPAFNLGASASGGGKLTYSSSNTDVATVSSNGLVTLKGAGNAIITITAAETSEYASATKQVTVIVSGGRYVNLPTNLQHGTLTVSPQGPIGKGETVTITSHPDAGYKLGTISAVDAFDRKIPVYGTGSTRTFTMTDADVTLSATFIESDVQMRGVGFYRGKPEHGTVYVVDGESHAVGSKVTLVAMPDEGYKLDSISVMDCITGEYPALSGSGDTYTFTMTNADIAIFATFAPADGEAHKITTYPVTRFLAAGSSIELSSDSAVAGEQVTVTVTPSSRRWVTYFTARDKDDNVIKTSGNMLSEGETQFTFTMPDSDVVVEIGFKTKFIPTISNGTAEVSNTNPSSGETVIVTVTPEPGYTAELIKIMGDELNYDTYPLRENYFEVPVATWDYGSVDIWMEYVGSRNVSLEASDHGTVSTSSTNPLVASTVTVTAEPERGYALKSLTVTDSNGNDVTVSGVGNTRTFVMPNADVTVRAEFVEGEAPTFPDVPDDAWYHDAVEWAASNGVMTGQGDGTFAPDKTLQRCEMAQLLWNMAGRPAADAGAVAGFPDYADGQWYSAAMAWAFAEGAITGYEDGRLGTSDPVTREQFVTIAWRLEGRPAGAGDLSAFPDAGDVSGFSREALAWAVSEGIVTGDGGRLSPAKALSRAEAATMLMRWRG